MTGKDEMGRTDLNTIHHISWQMEVSLKYITEKEESISDSESAPPRMTAI